jgi:hypothetical protein
VIQIEDEEKETKEKLWTKNRTLWKPMPDLLPSAIGTIMSISIS